MDISISGAQGIPEKAYLSIRVGETRRQLSFQDGDMKENFHFDVKKLPRHFAVDVFQKVGTKMVILADLQDKAGEGGQLHDTVQIARLGGGSLKMGMKIDCTVARSKSKAVSRQQDANDYLDQHRVQDLLHAMVHDLLTSRPADPKSYMSEYAERNWQSMLPSSAQSGAELRPSSVSARATAEVVASSLAAGTGQPLSAVQAAPEPTLAPDHIPSADPAPAPAPATAPADCPLSHESIMCKVLSEQIISEAGEGAAATASRDLAHEPLQDLEFGELHEVAAGPSSVPTSIATLPHAPNSPQAPAAAELPVHQALIDKVLKAEILLELGGCNSADSLRNLMDEQLFDVGFGELGEVEHLGSSGS